MLHVEQLAIQGIGGIDELTLSFRPGMNLIVGPNGVGKTTVLECIGHSFYAFAEGSRLVRRNVRTRRGVFKVTMRLGERVESKDIAVEVFHPNEMMFLNEGFEDAAREAIVFKANRMIPYAEVRSISRDPTDDSNRFTRDAANGTPIEDAKNWFVHRYLWSAHVGGLSPSQVKNLAHARQCFGLLDPAVSFSRVMPETNDVLVSTPTGEIYLEYLSAGYQSCLAVLLGLIKEIEYRWKDPGIDVRDFEGVLLIDEVDQHLHPEYHVRMVAGLRELLPRAQVIATTQSPLILQAAGPGEVIPLAFDGAGKVYAREVRHGAFGFQGWTVEEVLRDVMGLKEARTPVYLRALRDFEEALAGADQAAVYAAYKTLDLMLHPESPAREGLRAKLEAVGRKSS